MDFLTDVDYGDLTVVQKKHTILCVDGSNVLFQAAYNNDNHQNSKSSIDSIRNPLMDYENEVDTSNTDYLHHRRAIFTKFLNMINTIYKQFNCTKVYVCFDIGKSWRYFYTIGEFENHVPFTSKTYKGKRRQKMTPKEEFEYKRMLSIGKELIEFLREKTGVLVFTKQLIESDDFLAHIPTVEKHHDYIVMSTDGDLTQLLRHPNTQVYDMYHKVLRPACDVEWFMFEKCVRGDDSDYVQSAYPRVRLTEIKKAYEDTFAQVNFMKATWKDKLDPTIIHTVGDFFKENQLLMDLTKQPDSIIQTISDTIRDTLKTNRFVNKIEICRALNALELEVVGKRVMDNTFPWLHGAN